MPLRWESDWEWDVFKELGGGCDGIGARQSTRPCRGREKQGPPPSGLVRSSPSTNPLPRHRASPATMTQRVSVIIPCWNGERHLAETIRSLQSQTVQDFDLVLLDDASTDSSVGIAEELAGDRIRIVRNATSLGLARNWNKAMDLAETEYVALAHQDDLYHPAWLETLLAHLEDHPLAGFAHCRARTIDEEGHTNDSAIETYKLRFWQDVDTMDRGDVYRRLYHGNFICCPSILYRLEAHRRAGGFSEDLSFCADWDFSFRVLLAGMEIQAVPETLISYRRHRSNATRDQVASLNRYREEIRTLEVARKRGEEQGLLGRGTQPSLATRNNLLYDAFTDLQTGRRDEARKKIDFGKHELRGFAHDPIVRIFDLCLSMRRPGVLLLRMGLGLYLRLAPKKVS